MSIKDQLTIVVTSCDTYEDTWYPFFKLLDHFWSNCDLRIILNTESKEFSYGNLNIECFRKYRDNAVPYGERMIAHLKEVRTPYTLIIMDDFFLREPVDLDELSRVISYMNQDSDIVRFSFWAEEDSKFCEIDKYEKYGMLKQYEDYKFNFQVAVWRTDYLLASWKPHESPWDWELYGNYRSFNTDKKFYALKSGFRSPFVYRKYSDGGLMRGKWVIEDVDELFSENDIHIDYNERGIYSPEKLQENIFRMNLIERVKHEFSLLKSWGGYLYTKVLLWRITNGIRRMVNLEYANSYPEYMRKRISII